MKRGVQSLACACCLSCLTAAGAAAQSTHAGSRDATPARQPTHHRAPAPTRRTHPNRTPRAGAASRRLIPFADAPCYIEAGVASDPLCADPNVSDSTGEPSSASPDTAPSPVAPAVRPAVLQPSSIQPPPLLPRASVSGSGTLRLDIEPGTTQVFVDGFYAGSVAEINGKGFTLAAGWHRLVFRSPGYESAAANVTVQRNRTTTHHFVWPPLL
jgi:hypothetical protein